MSGECLTNTAAAGERVGRRCYDTVVTQPARPLTQDDDRNDPDIEAAYAAVPDGMKAEIVDGVFVMMNRPKMPHTRVASKLGMLLGAAYEMGIGGPGGWVFLDEPELHLGRRPDKLGPDLAGWRRERLPEKPEGAMITVAPDFVCEVLSHSTEDRDRGAKRRIYRREGVGHYWLIDPEARTLEVYGGPKYELVVEHEGEGAVRVPPFEGASLELSRLWEW
jgi:Uma2 family endonuclease